MAIYMVLTFKVLCKSFAFFIALIIVIFTIFIMALATFSTSHPRVLVRRLCWFFALFSFSIAVSPLCAGF